MNDGGVDLPRGRGAANVVSRSFCFTSFLASDVAIEELRALLVTHASVAVVGLEICKTTSRPHLQGVMSLRVPMRVNAVRGFLPVGTHVEVCRSLKNSIEYCRKEGRVVIDLGGSRVGQGHRSDLDGLYDLLLEGGVSAAVAARHHGVIKYPGGCRLVCSSKPSPPRRDVKCFCYWGPTGTGKSYRSHLGDAGNIFDIVAVVARGPVWFDGYHGQSILVLEEMHGQLDFQLLLRLLDLYPLTVNTKGGTVGAHWTEVRLTSNFPPWEWYPDRDFAPLQRRLETGGIEQLTVRYVAPIVPIA